MSETAIANRALQILGDRRITSLSEDSPQARDCNVVYEISRDSLLRSYYWQFAMGRASLASETAGPDFEWDYAFTLPTDFLRLIPDIEKRLSIEYRVEGNKILTNDAGPLEIRYIKRVTDPNKFDPLFKEALSAKMAMELAEVRTQSNSKKQEASLKYQEKIKEARRVAAFEQPAIEPDEDDWVTQRRI